MNQVWRKAQYAGGELLVLLALADWADDNGLCWPKIPAIARKSRLSERQVYRIIAEFNAAGILTMRSDRGRNHGNSYLINPEKLSESPSNEKLRLASLKPDILSPFPDGENLTLASLKPDTGVN